VKGTAREIALEKSRATVDAQERLPVAPPATYHTSGPAMCKRQTGAGVALDQVYANRGHLIANLDPLGLQERAQPYVLNLEYFGLSDADLETNFSQQPQWPRSPAQAS